MKGSGLLCGAASRWAAGVTWHLYKHQSSLFCASAVINASFFFTASVSLTLPHNETGRVRIRRKKNQKPKNCAGFKYGAALDSSVQTRCGLKRTHASARAVMNM